MIPEALLSGRGSATPGRNAYADLLRETRGLRREQQQARDGWFAQLASEKKEETLFELEILLKGLACFANPRNHPASGRRQSTVSYDFREHLHHARDGMARIVQLARTLLGERDRASVFQQYLETVLPEDTARSRLITLAMMQESPEASLFALRHAFTHLIEVSTGLLRIQRINYRLFHAHLATAIREIAQNSFFNPLTALEFRPEHDRISSTQVLELIQMVPGEQAHRLVALTFLALFRLLRYLKLVESIALDHTERRVAGRSFLVLSVLRSDARALSNFLQRHSGELLAKSYEQDLMRVPASEIGDRFEELQAEGRRLAAIRGALSGVSANLRLEMRRGFEHDLPAADAGTPDHELRNRLRQMVNNLRPALQNAVLFLGKALGVQLEQGRVFEDQAVTRATSERLRRDVWMFAQIARAFAHKARHADPSADHWSGVESFAFVREFLNYFRSMGYPLLRAGDYPNVESFLSAMNGLAETDLLDPVRLDTAIRECESFYDFLIRLFEQISKSDELEGISFDRHAAARALKRYLGD